VGLIPLLNDPFPGPAVKQPWTGWRGRKGPGDRTGAAAEPRPNTPGRIEPALAVNGLGRHRTGPAVLPSRGLPTGSSSTAGSAAKQQQQERGKDDDSLHAYL